MLNKDQSQDVASGGMALQAGGSITVVNMGVTVSEARQIALDVAKATFHELTGVGKETANIRVEDITNKVIAKLEADFPQGLQKAIDPDFQYALFTVQKEYARNGDQELGDLLVDLLVDRSKQDERNILQIVLNESLSTAPKLTAQQLSILALVFLLRYSRNEAIANSLLLGEYLDKHVASFVNNLIKNNASYQHLEFCGCGSISMGEITLEGIFMHTYPGQFMKGFDASEIESRGLDISKHAKFFAICLNDRSKLQISANDDDVLNGLIAQNNISPEDTAKIRELYNLGRMDLADVKEKIISIRPYMSHVFEVWSNSSMKNFTLTSVGMAIGHANVKRLVGKEFSDLSIWIN